MNEANHQCPGITVANPTINVDRGRLFTGDIDQVREANRRRAAVLAGNFAALIADLQHTIASRPAGSRCPTPQEVEILRKLTWCVKTLQNLAAPPRPSKADNSALRRWNKFMGEIGCR